MRGAEPVPVSGFRDRSHCGPACPQRQDFADLAQLQGSPRGSVRVAALGAHVVRRISVSAVARIERGEIRERPLPHFAPLNTGYMHCEFMVSRVEAREQRGPPKSYRHSTFTTSKALAPPGVTTSTLAPFFLPTSARASGDAIEILPAFASASGSPTICQTAFLSVSSSIKVTVAPNLTVSPDSFETSMTSARASLSSSSAMRPSLSDCSSFAAWYSAFSDRSPCVRASVIC